METKCHEGGTANNGYLQPNNGTYWPLGPRPCPTCGRCPTCGNGGYYLPQTTWVGTVTSTPINYATAEAK